MVLPHTKVLRSLERDSEIIDHLYRFCIQVLQLLMVFDGNVSFMHPNHRLMVTFLVPSGLFYRILLCGMSSALLVSHNTGQSEKSPKKCSTQHMLLKLRIVGKDRSWLFPSLRLRIIHAEVIVGS